MEIVHCDQIEFARAAYCTGVPGPDQLSTSITQVVIDASFACSKAALSTLLKSRPHLNVVFRPGVGAECLTIAESAPTTTEAVAAATAAAAAMTGGLKWPVVCFILFCIVIVLLACFLRRIIADKPIDNVVPRVSCETCTEMKTFRSPLDLSVSTSRSLASHETGDSQRDPVAI
uniref:Uncharacterized protein n=1 Tax=Plectus sambesii TaxID=2011161 RepID=A0A914XCZ8_9BILA